MLYVVLGAKHSIKIVFTISNMHTGQKSSF